jgi:hypothetical protein
MASLHPSVSELLARLRLRIRAHVVVETFAILLLTGVATFWAGLALDRFFEPAAAVRTVAWCLFGVAVVAVVAWWGVRRLAVPLDDSKLAQLLESHCPEIGDQLSTAIDLQNERLGMHEELVARSQRSAAEVAEGFRESRVLNYRWLRRMTSAALAGVASLFALAIFAPQIWSVYTQRLALADVAWPRSVELTIEGFSKNADGVWVRKVARNDDVPLRVAARLSDGLRDPRRVQIRYRWQSGGRGRDEFTRVGNAEASGQRQQDYAYVFERIADSVDFELRGGDGRLRPLRLEVVDRPKVLSLALEVEYPRYLQRTNRSLEVGPKLELPEGTRGTIVGRASKPLSRVVVRGGDDQTIECHVEQNTFRLSLPTVTDDMAWNIELSDDDGIGSIEPFSLLVASRRDEVPQVSAERQGIGSAATAIAVVPLQIAVSDDNRLASAWIELQSTGGAALRVPLTENKTLTNNLSTRYEVDLRALRTPGGEAPPFELAVGDRLSIDVQATDAYDLGDEPHVGAARKIQIEIVSEEELLARLARVELNLRQTFESVADKLIVLYEDLDDLQPASPAGQDLGAIDPADALAVVDLDDEAPGVAASEQLAIVRSRLAESARQLSTETLGVGQSFSDIELQLENNRVENEELRDRIARRIAKPLLELGADLEAKVAGSITQVSGEPATLSAARRATQQAVRDAEAILREMQGLENYNEVIAMLRDLIAEENKLKEKTQQQERDSVRNLLFD